MVASYVPIKYHHLLKRKNKIKFVDLTVWDKYCKWQIKITQSLRHAQTQYFSEKLAWMLDIENFLSYALTSYGLTAVFITTLIAALTNPLLGIGVLTCSILVVVIWAGIATYGQHTQRQHDRQIQLNLLQKLAEEESLFAYLNGKMFQNHFAAWNQLSWYQQRILIYSLPYDAITKKILLPLTKQSQPGLNKQKQLSSLIASIINHYLKTTYKNHLENPKPSNLAVRARYGMTALSTLSLTLAVSSITMGLISMIYTVPLIAAATTALLAGVSTILFGAIVVLPLTLLKRRLEIIRIMRETVILTLKEQLAFKKTLRYEFQEIETLSRIMSEVKPEGAANLKKYQRKSSSICKTDFFLHVEEGCPNILVRRPTNISRSLSF